MAETGDTREATESEIDKLRGRIKRIRKKHVKELRKAESLGFLNGVISTLRPGDLVVDCGANVGEITTLLAASGADVVAFEPDPWTFEELQSVVDGLENVTLINAAVGVEEAELTLYRAASFADDPRKQSVKSSLMPEAKSVDGASAGVEVNVIDFPAWLEARLQEGRKVALVKMDIEGAELELMEAVMARKLPERTGPFLVETHAWLFPDSRPRYKALAACADDFPPGRVNLDWI